MNIQPNEPRMVGAPAVPAPSMSLADLYELDDSLSLALDVSHKDSGDYTQREKELRRYLRAAKRYTVSLIGGAA